MNTIERVRELIEPLMTASGVEVVDIEHGPGLLRVYLDCEGGIDLDAITACSEQISDLLDLHDPVPGRFTLEVSSPGLERPLRTPAQFAKFVGSVVNVKTHPHVEGERRFSGLLSEVDAEAVVVDGRRLAYADIERARTVFEWGPTPPPGRPKPKAPAGKSTKATS